MFGDATVFQYFLLSVNKIASHFTCIRERRCVQLTEINLRKFLGTVPHVIVVQIYERSLSNVIHTYVFQYVQIIIY